MKILNFKTQTFIFLLLTSAFSAISEVKNDDETVKISVKNLSSLEKKSETIEIPWQNLAKIKGLNPKEIVVKMKILD